MSKRRYGALGVAVAGMVGLFATLLPAGTAFAHGAYTYPKSRTYACYLDGQEGGGGAMNPSNPACQEVMARNGKYPFWNWYGNLISDAGSTHKDDVPDGELCGPHPDFSAFNMARTDWPTTEIQSGATVNFRWAAWASHPGKFFQYVTKEGWNPNEKLSWSDLELFYTADHPPLNDSSGPEGAEYTWEATIPERSGRHIIYTVWQRSDSPEAFYSCSDVMFTGSGNGGGGGSDEQAPSAPSSLSASGSTASTAELSWEASSDNVGVSGYEVYRQNGERVASTSNTSVTVDGLSAETEYSFYVVAKDAAGNTSSQSSTVTVTTGSQPAAGQCSVDYTVTNEWSGGFSGEVTITNTGDTAISDWTLEFDFPAGQTITNGWSADWSQSGDHVTVQGSGWNGTIDPGSSVSAGFNGSGGGANPSSFLVNGESCTNG